MSSQILDEKPLIPISKSALMYSAACLYCLYLIDLAARFGVNIVFPEMQIELGLSDGQVGVIGSVLMLAMLIAVMPFAYFADKISKKKAILTMGSLWGFGTMLCGITSSYTALLLGRTMVGAGNSALHPVAVSMLTSWFKRSQWARVISVLGTANGIGPAIGTWIAGAAVIGFGTWRAAFWVLGGISLAIVVCGFFIKDANVRTTDTKNKVRFSTVLNATIKNIPLLMVCSAGGMAYVVVAGNALWVPMYLARDLGWDTVRIATNIGLVYLVTGIPASIISGIVLDFGCKKLPCFRILFPALCYVLTGLFYMYFIMSNNFLGYCVGSFIFFMAPIGTATATQELVSAQFKSSSLGLYVFFLQAIGSIGPLLVGWFSEDFGLKASLFYLQIFIIAGAGCFVIASFYYKKQLDQALEESKKCEEDECF